MSVRALKEALNLKRFLYFPCVLCLVIGLLVGVLLPVDFQADDKPAASPSSNNGFSQPSGASQSGGGGTSSDPAAPAPLDPAENFPLLGSACLVNRLIQQQDWTALAACVHPERGVTFTPYSTVEPETDLCFTADQIKNLSQDQNIYTWGFEDGRGDPIQMTLTQYFERYVYDRDYTQATEIGVDRIITGGNALENLTEAYPGCRFVDFCFPSADPVNDGLDWSSLKLVFQPETEHWYLVGIVHGEWTI